MRPIKPYKKHIAPRLASGKSREAWGGRLPEAIKYGLYQIARREGKSVSWVVEEVIIQFFGLKQPAYKAPKPTPAEEARKEAQSQDLAESRARQKHRDQHQQQLNGEAAAQL